MNAPVHPVATPGAPRGTDSSIGGLLLESGKITPENAERVLRMQKELGIRFGEAAQRLGLITEADIQQVLARQFDYPYLQAGEGKFSPKLVAAYQPFSHQVEQLRAIRSQLMLRWFARGRKALTIVEIGDGDGASLFAANLAVVFSQLGEQTLLVDANLRAPQQQQIFDLSSRSGLSDILAGRAGQDAVTKIDSFIDLSVLAAGTLPPNPQEMLSRPGFGSLATQLEARYDVVLYDVAPFEQGADALAVAMRTGGVLLVARRHKTMLAEIGAMNEQLSQAGVQVVGSVLVDF
ncbi:chain length determinant protein tyrosine kinase EpsG [Duganella sp. BJB488]|uniref:chain length determinant protein tyrosine kinase EpsG n=1 Tax=unclassified Duganella TaxID=2636909 RepID=UPI000E34F83F|nr:MULTISPECIES: chain length determinant protein tyrosine kinase EpsG [unclassified Duganella]NVD73922.1 chain length determinant protein tyrosine kinase EpsG [Duganella sp. BJB1802]RFP12399.1 chain length determinant protein tyrosine kinase EpsG [Duganella sp. BJB489]RFP16507.1 chain length determinant protein tyrosine kinase EpsG [Duganella sp. BJB488]RFP30763.1 chain length determinant protein tyrosine kinase EpsG [Duganella sp. BJB480]